MRFILFRKEILSIVAKKIIWTIMIIVILIEVTFIIKMIQDIELKDAKLQKIIEDYNLIVEEYERIRETYKDEIDTDENISGVINAETNTVITNSQENQDIQEIHARYNSTTDTLDYNIIRKGL